MMEDEVDDLLKLSWWNYQMKIDRLCAISMQHQVGKTAINPWTNSYSPINGEIFHRRMPCRYGNLARASSSLCKRSNHQDIGIR
jgi:hypothetical protein